MPQHTVGEKLRYWRKKRGYSQMALAEKASVSEKTIQRIENGKSPKSTTLREICAALGLNPLFLEEDLKELTHFGYSPSPVPEYKLSNPYEHLYKWIRFMRDENFSFDRMLKAFETCVATKMDPNDPDQVELAKIIIKHALGDVPDAAMAPFCSPSAVLNLIPIEEFSAGYLFQAKTDQEDDSFIVWVDRNISTEVNKLDEVETMINNDLQRICQIVRMKAHTSHKHEIPNEPSEVLSQRYAQVRLTWRDIKTF